MDFESAHLKLKSARCVDRGKPIGKTTRLFPAKAIVKGFTYRAVTLELHSTYIVTWLENGWTILNTGGWDTHTTWSWINNYAPGRYYSDGKRNHYVGSAIGYTAPRVWKCRMCSGAGRHTHVETYETWWHGRQWSSEPNCPDNLQWDTVWVLSATGERLPTDWPGHPAGMNFNQQWDLEEAGLIHKAAIPTSKLGHCRGHREYFPEPEVTYSECWGCKGTGQRDYGSKPIRIPFEDGIVVDSEGEWVCDESRMWRENWIEADTDTPFVEAIQELRGYTNVA